MNWRIGEYLIVATWMASMSWLFVRDVLPRWLAGEPPPPPGLVWLDNQGTRFQYGIFDVNEVRQGTYWSVYHVAGGSVTRTDSMVLGRLPLLGRLVFHSEMAFSRDAELDEVRVTVEAAGARMVLEGQRQGRSLAFLLTMGSLPAKEFTLDAQAARTLGDAIRPFSALVGLEVGQSWIIQVLDPLSLLQGGKSRPKPVVVRVVDVQTIWVRGAARECWVVEAEGLRAWVESTGRVARQEVQVPGLGMLRIEQEDFNGSELDQIRSIIHRDDQR